jgi:hypothetical protein
VYEALCLVSAGHEVDDPLQVSSLSQLPAALRQTVPVFPAGCWQVVLVPLQVSAVQGRPSSVQGVPFGLRTSVGHAALEPSQYSMASHSPAAALHTVPPASRASAGHAVLVPVHASAGSHGPADARHSVPALPAV